MDGMAANSCKLMLWLTPDTTGLRAGLGNYPRRRHCENDVRTILSMLLFYLTNIHLGNITYFSISFR